MGRTAPLQRAATNKCLPIKRNRGPVCQRVCWSDLTPTWFLGLTLSHITISDITPTSSSKTPGRFHLELRCNFYYPRKPYHVSTSNSISSLFIYPSCCFSQFNLPLLFLRSTTIFFFIAHAFLRVSQGWKNLKLKCGS